MNDHLLENKKKKYTEMNGRSFISGLFAKGMGGERDFPVQRLCGSLWRVEMIIYSCYFFFSFWLLFGFSLPLLLGAGFYLDQNSGRGERHCSIGDYNSIPQDPISLWLIPERVSHLETLVTYYGIPSRTPFFFDQFFLWKMETGMNGNLFMNAFFFLDSYD